MSDESTNKPPYLPYVTFKNIITGLNKNGLIPARIDKTVLSGQSGGTQSYIWAALRFFGLIDEGKAPTEDLKALARAEGEERKKLWREIFERAFAPIIGDLDLPTATLGMLHEKFADQGLSLVLFGSGRGRRYRLAAATQSQHAGFWRLKKAPQEVGGQATRFRVRG
jgi:hypothetical protein